MTHRSAVVRRLSATLSAAALATVCAALTGTTTASAQGLPEQAARAAADLSDRFDPSGTLGRYAREAADGANGPLLAPGPPSWPLGGVPCRPSAAHPRPVVLLHGTFDNGDAVRSNLGAALTARGFCVVTPTVGAYAGDPGRGGLDSIQWASGPQLAMAIDHVREVTGAAQVDLVGYSQGAVISGYAAKVLRPGQVANVVSVAGFWGAGLTGLVPAEVPPPAVQAVLVGANLRGLSELVPGSPFMLAWFGPDRTPFQPGTGYTLIASRYDATVPPERSFFVGGGVRPVVVQDGCEADHVGHGGIPRDPRVQALVAEALGAPGPIPC